MRETNHAKLAQLCLRALDGKPLPNPPATHVDVQPDLRQLCRVAEIACKGHRYHLGSFDEEIEGAKAYDARACELFGEFARLNFPDETETGQP